MQPLGTGLPLPPIKNLNFAVSDLRRAFGDVFAVVLQYVLSAKIDLFHTMFWSTCIGLIQQILAKYLWNPMYCIKGMCKQISLLKLPHLLFADPSF